MIKIYRNFQIRRAGTSVPNRGAKSHAPPTLPELSLEQQEKVEELLKIRLQSKNMVFLQNQFNKIHQISHKN